MIFDCFPFNIPVVFCWPKVKCKFITVRLNVGPTTRNGSFFPHPITKSTAKYYNESGDLLKIAMVNVYSLRDVFYLAHNLDICF